MDEEVEEKFDAVIVPPEKINAAHHILKKSVLHVKHKREKDADIETMNAALEILKKRVNSEKRKLEKDDCDNEFNEKQADAAQMDQKDAARVKCCCLSAKKEKLNFEKFIENAETVLKKMDFCELKMFSEILHNSGSDNQVDNNDGQDEDSTKVDKTKEMDAARVKCCCLSAKKEKLNYDKFIENAETVLKKMDFCELKMFSESLHNSGSDNQVDNNDGQKEDSTKNDGQKEDSTKVDKTKEMGDVNDGQNKDPTIISEAIEMDEDSDKSSIVSTIILDDSDDEDNAAQMDQENFPNFYPVHSSPWFNEKQIEAAIKAAQTGHKESYNELCAWDRKELEIYDEINQKTEKVPDSKEISEWQIEELKIIKEINRKHLKDDSDDECNAAQMDQKGDVIEGQKIDPTIINEAKEMMQDDIKKHTWLLNQLKMALDNYCYMMYKFDHNVFRTKYSIKKSFEFFTEKAEKCIKELQFNEFYDEEEKIKFEKLDKFINEVFHSYFEQTHSVITTIDDLLKKTEARVKEPPYIRNAILQKQNKLFEKLQNAEENHKRQNGKIRKTELHEQFSKIIKNNGLQSSKYGKNTAPKKQECSFKSLLLRANSKADQLSSKKPPKSLIDSCRAQFTSFLMGQSPTAQSATSLSSNLLPSTSNSVYSKTIFMKPPSTSQSATSPLEQPSTSKSVLEEPCIFQSVSVENKNEDEMWDDAGNKIYLGPRNTIETLDKYMETVKNLYTFCKQALFVDSPLSNYMFVVMLFNLKNNLIYFTSLINFILLLIVAQYPKEKFGNLRKMYILCELLYEKNIYMGCMRNLKTFLLACVLNNYHMDQDHDDHYLFRKRASIFYSNVVKEHFRHDIKQDVELIKNILNNKYVSNYSRYGALLVLKFLGLPILASVIPDLFIPLMTIYTIDKMNSRNFDLDKISSNAASSSGQKRKNLETDSSGRDQNNVSLDKTMNAEKRMRVEINTESRNGSTNLGTAASENDQNNDTENLYDELMKVEAQYFKLLRSELLDTCAQLSSHFVNYVLGVEDKVNDEITNNLSNPIKSSSVNSFQTYFGSKLFAKLYLSKTDKKYRCENKIRDMDKFISVFFSEINCQTKSKSPDPNKDKPDNK